MSKDGLVLSPTGLGNPSPDDSEDMVCGTVEEPCNSCLCCADLTVVKEILEAQIAEGQYREKRLS